MSTKYSSYVNYLTVVAGFSLLTGCSMINKAFDNKESVNYRDAETVSSLEVPPDLTNPQYDSTFQVNAGKVVSSTNRSVGNAVSAEVPALQTFATTTTTASTRGLNAAEVADNGQSLNVSGSYDDSWARTGVALANIGFAVEGQDKNKGVYAVKWVGYSKEGKSISSQLKQMFSFKRELLAEGTQQLIQVSKTGGSANLSTLRILDVNGQLADRSTSKKILDRLRAELPKVTSGSQPIVRNMSPTSIDRRTGRNIDSDDYDFGKRVENKSSKPRQKKQPIDRSYETERTGRNIDQDDYEVGSRVTKSMKTTKQVQRNVDRSYETKRTGRNIDQDDHGYGEKASAKTAKRVVDTNGVPSLTIFDSFDNAWTRTGLSLTKMGFTVDGQDKAKGLYAVRWVGYSKDGKSLTEQLQQMMSFKKEMLEEGTEQLIRVNKVAEGALLQVFDKDGKAAQPAIAKQILNRLRKELNR